MNPTKTNFVLIGTRPRLQNTHDFSLTINGAEVPPSGSNRMLGVVLDPFLTWEKHIDTVCKKCNYILISLARFRHHFSQDTLKIIISTHVFPHIIYCLTVWGCAAKTQLSRIQKLINFAARVVTGARRQDRISPALQALGWERLERLIVNRDLVKVHTALHEPQAPAAIREMFVARSAVSVRSTRSTEAGQLQLPKCNITSTQKHFRFRAAKTWNILPPHIKRLSSHRALKMALRELN